MVSCCSSSWVLKPFVVSGPHCMAPIIIGSLSRLWRAPCRGLASCPVHMVRWVWCFIVAVSSRRRATRKTQTLLYPAGERPRCPQSKGTSYAGRRRVEAAAVGVPWTERSADGTGIACEIDRKDRGVTLGPEGTGGWYLGSFGARCW